MHERVPYIFDFEAYFQSLRTTTTGRRLHCFHQLGSTNDYLKRLPAEATPHGLICVAIDQTKGRGQYKRGWESHPGKSLTFSVVMKPKSAARLQLLMLTMGISILETIRDVAGTETFLKWPNDIMINDRKIAGILAEGTFLGDQLERFILGVGLNINNTNFFQSGNDIAVSLLELTGKIIQIEPFLSKICNRFEQRYGQWETASPALVRDINSHYPGLGKWNRVEVNGTVREESFKFLGLDHDGYPLFLDEKASIKKVTHQHIRFRPIE